MTTMMVMSDATLPLAEVKKIRSGFVGSAAMPDTRPLVASWPGVPPFRIGAGPIAPAWYEAQPPPLGRYGTSHLNDVWGFSRLACVDY